MENTANTANTEIIENSDNTNANTYNYTEIESRWQKYWDDNESFKTEPDSTKPKYYVLVEFPYPSGQGLHIGHPRPYTAMDIVARYKRLRGYNVLFPLGWDAFGLPTENFAIKNKIHPAVVTKDNVARFKAQCKAIGLSVDWSREINTTDPAYYKWTQWIFLQLFRRGLAYKKESAVNWCTDCRVVLANEEVVNGACERCNGQVVRKVKSQWMLKITEYAQRLIDDLDGVDYPERVKQSQVNWIGRSEGAEVEFAAVAGGAPLTEALTVYTTRPDTLFGATYMVMSPEHPYIENEFKPYITNYDEVAAYRDTAAKKSDFERSELAAASKDKTGVKLNGIEAVNPVNGAKIPVYVSDYVLMSYGTGVIMAVPAHDTRDWEFAKKFGCDIVEVISSPVSVSEQAYTDVTSGVLVNSDFLNGLSVREAKAEIIAWLAAKGLGKSKVNYKLRDWVFSRQRYWGEPIPVVYCEHCGGYVPLPESELPLKLPEVDSYMPTDDGESPLSALTAWVETTCPVCGKPARRETDTMPQWAGSSWYYLRYCDPRNVTELIGGTARDYYMGDTGVDWYNGGMEHTTLHLLYSRFWHKCLYDIGVVKTKEPYARRTSHGMILGEDGQKMSKSRGNVINPDDVIRGYGTDALRLYEMFIGDFEKTAPWSTGSIKGCKRFLDRAWGMLFMVDTADAASGGEYRDSLRALFHKTIKKVSADIESLKFNTAIAALMTLQNEIYLTKAVTKAEFKTFLLLLNPFAPHIAEELYQRVFAETGNDAVLSRDCAFPEYDEALCKDDTVEIVVQINGKIREHITVTAARAADKAELLNIAKASETVRGALAGKTVVKEIAVPGKLVNIVVR